MTASAAHISRGSARRGHLLSPFDRYSVRRDYLSHLNNGLKAIGRREGKRGKVLSAGPFSELSTYWARHTWATLAYSLGVPVDVIAQGLGHADSDHSTTLIYIRPDAAKVDAANRRVIDAVTGRAPGGYRGDASKSDGIVGCSDLFL